MIKVLKENSEVFRKLELVNSFLNENEIEIHQTTYKGLIFKINDNYYRYQQDDQYADSFPPFIEGRYILCDHNGNTDFYN